MKKVKIITIILGIILIALVAFGGVYVQTQNRMEDKVKNYQLSKELSGARIIDIKVAESTTEAGEDGTEVEVATNPDILTIENYLTIKQTIEKRLQNLGAKDYNISLNDATGKIRVELAENDLTDTYAYFLTAENETKIIDSETKEELIKDEMIKGAQYHYTANNSGYQVYLTIELDKNGQAEIEKIKDTYALLSTEIEEINAKTEETAEDATEETAEETTENGEQENTENAKQEETKNEEETKKIATLKIMGTEYDIDKIEKNKITVKVGAEATSDTTMNNNMNRASQLALLIASGKYPIPYEIENNRYVYSDITKNQIEYFAIACIVALVIVLGIISIKYRAKGLLASISFIGYVAILSLILRYTNVVLSIEGIGAIILSILLNIRMNKKILSKMQNKTVKEAVKETYKEMYLKIIPIIIIVITFCFSGWDNLISFGLVMFWGLIVMAIYNVLITKPLLKIREEKWEATDETKN